jgi:uncharacterized protein (DUF4415 family)
MSGSKMTSKTDLQKVRATGDFQWDGRDEDDRPLSPAELKRGVAAYRRKRGRPAGSNKVSTTIRFDADVLDAFRRGGPGWQSRMNSALRSWLDQQAER